MIIAALRDLFPRADVVGAEVKWVLSDEAMSWSPSVVHTLESLGILRKWPPLDSISCDECDEPHTETVLYSDQQPPRPFIPCASNGRIFIEPARLLRWSFSAGAIASWIADIMRTGAMPVEIIESRCWSLGVSTLPSVRGPVFLLPGSAWPDARKVFAEKLPRTPRLVVLTLSPAAQPEWNSRSQWICVSQLISENAAGRVEVDASLVNRREPVSSMGWAGERVGRRRLEEDPIAREIYERGERIRADNPGISREQTAARLSVPFSTYKRYVRRFGTQPDSPRGS